MRTGQPDQTIAEVLALKQNKDHENDDNAGCRKGMKQRWNKALQALQCAWIGLKDFHRDGSGRCHFGCVHSRCAFGVLGLVQFLTQILQHTGCAFKRASAGGSVAK